MAPEEEVTSGGGVASEEGVMSEGVGGMTSEESFYDVLRFTVYSFTVSRF